MHTRLALSFLSLLGFAATALSQDFACEELMVPMRDGVKLAADVYRPLRQSLSRPSES